METKHIHVWSDWVKVLWYTPEGRFQGEFRSCADCTSIRTRRIKRDTRSAVLQPTTSVYAGLFDKRGKVLVKRGGFANEWDAPGGGIDAQLASNMSNERMLFTELARHVSDKVGIIISEDMRPILIPAVLQGGGDWAFPIVIGQTSPPTKGDCIYLSPEELEFLARGPEGERILSGWGKRMHRILLRLLTYSPNEAYVEQAKTYLATIEAQM